MVQKYEGSFLIVPPHGNTRYKKSKKVKHIVNLLDLAPTMADIAVFPTKLSGRKELDAYPGPKGRGLGRFYDHHLFDWLHTVSTPNWQLISYYDGSFELYNLTNDSHQFKNIADLPSSLEIIDKLKKHIPEENRWKYFIRYRDYKILVPETGNIQFLDQKYEGSNSYDIADEVPDLVKKIKLYINNHQPQQKKFSIPVL